MTGLVAAPMRVLGATAAPPPEGFEEILLNEEARVTSARGGEGALRHASVVRSVNGVPVVAERQSIGGVDSEFAGVDLVLGAPLLADEVVLAAGAAGVNSSCGFLRSQPNSDFFSPASAGALPAAAGDCLSSLEPNMGHLKGGRR